MKEAVLKNQEKIRGELGRVRETLSFCCGEKYASLINDKLNDLLIYVYSDDLDNNKIKKVDLFKIAIEFSRDMTFDLEMDENRREKVELYLGKVLLNAYYSYNRRQVPYTETINYIKDSLKRLNEFNEDLEENTNKLFSIVELFNKDYEVRDIEKRVYLNQQILENMNIYSSQEKKELLKSMFNIDVESLHEANDLWEKAAFFRKEMLHLLDEPQFKEMAINSQAAFCRRLGARGEGSYAVVNDAKYRGLLPSSEKIETMEMMHNRNYKKRIESFIREHSNLDEIFEDLRERNIDINEDYLYVNLFSSRDLLGIQLPNLEGEPVCLVFHDRESMYADIFMDTYFHEVIHYVGGTNSRLKKHRLVYNDDIRYASLDEAFTNCLTKECYKKYNENYKYRNQMLSLDDDCQYNDTLPYMRAVFKLYKKELLEIHFSNSMTLTEANKKCPLDEIANAVYRISSAEEDVEEITKEEINKLTRGRK